MNIALLTEIINRKSGSRAPLEIAKALYGLGHQINVFGYSYDFEEETENELKKIGIKVSIIPPNKFLSPLRIAKQLKEGEFDIISFHGTLPFFLGALLSKIPIVRTYYGVQLDGFLDKFYLGKPNFILRLLNIPATFAIRFREKFMSKNSARIIAISKCTQDEHELSYSLKSDCVYLGHSPSSFKYQKKHPSHFVTILSVSRIIPYKGFHNLIHVFNILNKTHKNLRLIIVGSTPDKSYFEYLRKIANNNVILKTNISDEELKSCYQNADIYATFDRSLVFSLTILEAATFGIPSVALNLCAAKEEIKHGKSGYLANDEKEFRNYLERLIANKMLRIRLGSNAKTFAKQFSWEKLAKEYSRIFQKI